MKCWYCEFYHRKKDEEPCGNWVNKDKFKLWKTKGEDDGK